MWKEEAVLKSEVAIDKNKVRDGQAVSADGLLDETFTTEIEIQLMNFLYSIGWELCVMI